ncbi:MAG: hypothetical protein ABIO05_07125 [Ferruginibacter sp.]
MKKNILLAATAVATGLAYYLVSNKKSKKKNKKNYFTKPAHHMTDVFARAKEEAVK